MSVKDTRRLCGDTEGEFSLCWEVPTQGCSSQCGKFVYVNDEEIDSMTSFLRMKRLKSIFSDLPKSIFTTSPPSAARKWEDLRNEIMKLRIPETRSKRCASIKLSLNILIFRNRAEKSKRLFVWVSNMHSVQNCFNIVAIVWYIVFISRYETNWPIFDNSLLNMIWI